MTKKGYQKRLPTALPEVRQLPSAPAPSAPKPRISPEAAAPGSVDRFAPGATTPHFSSTGWIVGLVLSCLVVLAGGAAILVPPLLDDAQDGTFAEPGGTSPVARSPDTSYVESRVLPNGDIVVRQWIRAAEPIRLVRLTLPQVPGAEDASARQVAIVADGLAVTGQATISDDVATYAFPATTAEVLLSYRLTGAVELSDSVPGRVLAVFTSLDVGYGSQVERETRVVRGPEMLSLACSPSPEVSPTPCGEAFGDDEWRVELTGLRVDDRVVAQLNLG